MKNMRKVLIAVVLTLVAFTVGATGASANLIPTLTSVTGGPGDFSWNYAVTLSGDQNAQTGAVPGATSLTGPGASASLTADYFTIYDFAGFTGVTSFTAPAGTWGFESLSVGATPSTVLAVDSASLPNLTWFKLGATLFGFCATNTCPPATDTEVGTFTAHSTFGLQTLGMYVSDATLNNGFNAGSIGVNQGATQVPTVPEPGTLLLVGSALAGLGFVTRRFKR